MLKTIHVRACIVAGDWAGSVTSHRLVCVSWHGHVVKGLRLLIALCTLSEALSPLAAFVAVRISPNMQGPNNNHF